MAATWTDAELNAMADAEAARITHLSLHTGNPGTTGANEATVLHLDRSAEIAGLPVDSGDYSIYTVPGAERWLVVVNAATGHWGLTRDEVGAHSGIGDPLLDGSVQVTLADGSAVRKIESFNDLLAASGKLGEVKEVYFKGWNDEQVHMWVIFPPDFDPAKKWPLL